MTTRMGNGRWRLTPASDAYDTHKKFWADSGDDIDLPVDPYEIASAMGIPVIRTRLGINESGFLLCDGPKAAIYVNDTFHPNRNRFTVAHELGHYVKARETGTLPAGNARLHKKRDELASTGTDTEEIYANRFAAALLMPAKEVKKLHSRGLTTVELANRFRVSEHAMTLRLKNLGVGSG